jgi:predicted lipid carrier protein YhbT
VRFLSPEWLTAAADALRAAAPGDTGAQLVSPQLVVQQMVTGGPDGDVAYLVRVGPDALELVPGRGAADVVFTEDWDTAAAIGEGRLSPQAAFVQGRVRASGNVSMVMAAQDTLASVESALANVREATSYGR